jgi:hypothetical protein
MKRNPPKKSHPGNGVQIRTDTAPTLGADLQSQLGRHAPLQPFQPPTSLPSFSIVISPSTSSTPPSPSQSVVEVVRELTSKRLPWSIQLALVAFGLGFLILSLAILCGKLGLHS